MPDRTSYLSLTDRSIRGFLALAFVPATLFWGTGCDTSGGGHPSGIRFSGDAPRIVGASYIDADDNGVDRGDVVVLQFNQGVILSGSRVAGLGFEIDEETLGDGATQQQSVPGSDRVEVFLGEDPMLGLANGETEINVVLGRGVIEIENLDGAGAVPADASVEVADGTASPPRLVASRYYDATGDGNVGPGDLVVAIFDKPIVVPLAATVAQNFVLPVTGDSFGVPARLSPVRPQAGNRAVRIELGTGAVLTPGGSFTGALLQAGSASAIEVAPGTNITDTVVTPSGALVASRADLGDGALSFFGNGREAAAVQGVRDGFGGGLDAAVLSRPAAADVFAGSLIVEGEAVNVDLLFVADRDNDRVLIFERFGQSSFPAASWVLGQPDFSSAAGDADPTVDSALPVSAATLESPSGVAFDAGTNTLYVADQGNHRVLIWEDLFRLEVGTEVLTIPNGLAATGVLGQGSFVGSSPNRGGAQPSPLSLSAPSAVATDGSRLVVADRDNHRVLVYNTLPLSSNILPSAIIGQTGGLTGAPNAGGAASAATLNAPADVFLSPMFLVNGVAGALVVADTANHRVLLYDANALVTGLNAAVVVGQADFATTALGLSATGLNRPSGVQGAGTATLYVADRDNHRVMIYNAPTNGAAGVALGQADAMSGLPNRGGAPGANTLRAPERVAVSGTRLAVVDSGNHRVLRYSGLALPLLDVPANGVVGQPSLNTASPSGGRFNRPGHVLVVNGRLLLSDTANHRVLIYDNVPLEGDPDPDVVLGQADAFSTQSNAGGAPTASTLSLPTGLATDGTALAVADTGNHRVLIWSSVPTTFAQPADIVLGQADLTSGFINGGRGIGRNTFNEPLGVSVDDDVLAVADRANHRVLIFPGFSGLTNFAEASAVLGQEDGISGEANRGESVRSDTLRLPEGVLLAGGRVFVADTGNHRVLIWNFVPGGDGPRAQGVLGQIDFRRGVPSLPGAATLLEPTGLAISADGALLAVADSGHHRILLFEDVRGEPRGLGARTVLGQGSFFSGAPNRGGVPTLATQNAPRGIFYNGYELYVADLGNNRLAVYR